MDKNKKVYAAIFSFPKDKIEKEERKRLADEFAGLLGINILICDKDCEVTYLYEEENK